MSCNKKNGHLIRNQKDFFGQLDSAIRIKVYIPQQNIYVYNSFQKWLRILIWLIIPMIFQNLLPVSCLSASAAKINAMQ